VSWKQFIKDYLNFSRKERIGILVVIGLILSSLFLPDLIAGLSDKKHALVDTSWIAAVQRLEIKDSNYSNDQSKDEDENVFGHQYDRSSTTYFKSNPTNGELFDFDPNKISSTEWKRLGLRDKTIQTIQNFLSKGGHFYKPEDLQRIYGLPKNQYERLLPYVKIALNTPSTNEQFISSKPATDLQSSKTYTARYSVIEINNADTSAFVFLPGIGSKLASRIVSFREKLGGFYSIEQIGETYGLADSVFQKIRLYLKIDNPSLKKININTATVDELKAHPYIKFNLANPIVAYRNEHGAFSKIEDIKKVMAVTDEIYKKIAPYLSL
jgi:competence ComEA-like helix-hairpin-helix protein